MGRDEIEIPAGQPGGGSSRKLYECGCKESGPWWTQSAMFSRQHLKSWD